MTNILSLKGRSGGSGKTGKNVQEPPAPHAMSISSSSIRRPELRESDCFISSWILCSSARALGSTCMSACREALRLHGMDFSLRWPRIASVAAPRRSAAESSEPRRPRRDAAQAAVMSGGSAPPMGGSAGPRIGETPTCGGTTNFPERSASWQSPLACFVSSDSIKSEDDRTGSSGVFWLLSLGRMSIGTSLFGDSSCKGPGPHMAPARHANDRAPTLDRGRCAQHPGGGEGP
mmetsp:Transcript_133209/g.385455  ORF Transcript_133209/g.385455 Transcript_133209/m.385455 type:complete len:233 (-) Transcript_133209:9-707(-)